MKVVEVWLESLRQIGMVAVGHAKESVESQM